MILGISNGDIAVARYFIVGLSYWGLNAVRVEIPAGLRVEETDDSLVTDKSYRRFWVKLRFLTVRVEEPIVVCILVVVAGNLLLIRALRKKLNVGVKKTSSIAHILESSFGSIGNLQWAVCTHFSTFEIGLKQ